MLARIILMAAICFAVTACGSPADPAPNAPTAAASTEHQPGTTAPLSADLVPAFRQIQEGTLAPARLRLRRILADRPDDGQAHFLLGLTYHEEKQYGRATEHFTRAIALRPDYGPSWYFLGWSSFYLGDLRTAEDAMLRHRTLHPEEPDTRFALGLIALERGDLTDAEQAFHESIELLAARTGGEREIAKARVRLADVYMLRGDHVGAREELNLAIALHDDFYEAHYKLSRVRLRLGDEEGSDRSFERYLALREQHYPQTRFPE